MYHGAKTQAARLGQPTFSRVVKKREQNDPRRNVTEECVSWKNVTATYDWAFTRHDPHCSL